MWKLLRAFLLFFICIMLGGAASEKLKKRAGMLEGLISDLNTMRVRLKNENSGIGSIVSELAENGNLKKFWLEMKKEVDLNRSFAQAFSKSRNMMDGLNKKETEVFGKFAADFGKDDRQSELNRLDALIAEFDEAEKKCRSDYPGKIKLLRSLSTLGGIALALTVI